MFEIWLAWFVCLFSPFFPISKTAHWGSVSACRWCCASIPSCCLLARAPPHLDNIWEEWLSCHDLDMCQKQLTQTEKELAASSTAQWDDSGKKGTARHCTDPWQTPQSTEAVKKILGRIIDVSGVSFQLTQHFLWDSCLSEICFLSPKFHPITHSFLAHLGLFSQ